MSATSSISSLLNQKTRISGLSGSGLDVDALVEKLMKIETAKVDKAKQEKQVLEWKKDDYRSITTALKSLKDKYFNITSSSNLRTASAFNKTVATASDTSIVKVSGSSSSGDSTHTINVGAIATVGATASTSSVAIDPATATMESFTGLAAGATALTIGTKDYTIIAGETVKSFMTRVNGDTSNSTYRLSYDSTGSKFVISTKNTGVNTVSTSGTFLEKANLTAVGTPLTVSGTDATFSIDGINYTSKSNTFTTDDITYTFLKGGTTNVNSTRDIDGIIKNVKEFVDAYNSVIKTLNTETTEKRYRDYTPLTDDQKSSMKDSDIKLWEEKAKSGLLNGDSLLTDLSSKLKQTMYERINLSDGTTSTLSSIGIGTTSRYDMGVLTVDETKLRTALTENPDKVAEMFTRESSTAYNLDGNNTVRTSESGVLWKVDDLLNDYIRTNRNSNGKKGFLIEKAGLANDTTDISNAMQDLISDKEDLISTLTDKLTDKENAYYRKFTAMETALSKMNSQSSWLTQQLGGNSQ